MNRYALIVGIDEYSASTPLGGYISPGRLRKARSDAEAIHALLKDHGNFNDILPLYDEAATHAELVKALKNVLLEQGPQSEVLIYYAGHGFTARPTEFERQGYLATYDCQLTGQGETLTEVKDGLSFATLNGVISQAREKGLAGLAVFLDCCESEFVIEQSLMNNRLSGLTQRGYFLSAACRSYEVARETGTYGVYTGALVAALEDRAAGEMTVSEAHNRVVRALKGSRQEPIAFGYGNSMVMVSYQRSLGKEAAVSDENPYQGLKAFQKETARFFFGREEETRRLWERLQRSNFVAVLGPSGSGKSSVVRAGLAKQLVDEGWQVLTMMPGGDPPGRLRAEVERFLAKSEVSVSAGGRRRLVGALEGDGLLAMAEAWAVELPGVRVLLLVDQFEEVFTQCAADKRDCFIRALVAVGQAKTPLAVVMTMRSDFYNEWLVTGQPSMLVSDYSVPLSPLRGENCENLKAAIVEPAGLQGYEIEAELLELLLEDVTAEENSLPLLEFALEALWEARDTEKRVLTVTAYRQMEKLTGALNRQAEKVYEQMREPERIWAKRICLQLVRIGRDGRDTRQRQPKETLLALAGKDAGKQQIVADVIQDLVDGRLLVSGDDEGAAYVDMAHEALLEGWKRFSRWRKENRDARRLVQKIEDAYEEWDEKGDDYLLSGGLLLELKEQWDNLNEILNEKRRPDLESFFGASAEREKQNVADLERALAETQLQEKCRKVRDKLQYTSTRIVDAAFNAIELVGESQEKFDRVVPAVKDTLSRASNSLCEQLKLKAHRGEIWSVDFSKDGNMVVSGSGDKTIRLWDFQGNPASQPFLGHVEAVRAVAFHPYKNLIVSGSSDKTIRLWDFEGNSVGHPFIGHTASVLSVAFSPDGTKIISASRDKTLRLWNLKGNTVSKPFTGHTESVLSAAFSPNGKKIVSGSVDKTLILWNLEGKHLGTPFRAHTDSVLSVSFSPDGSQIVSGGHDKSLVLWSLKGKQIGKAFSGHTAAVRSVSFNPNGDTIVSGSFDNTVRIWNLRGDVVGNPLIGHSDAVLSVAFSSNGTNIVSGSSDQTIRVWNFKNAAIDQQLLGHDRPIRAISFSAKNSQIASASEDKTIRLWDLQGNAVGKPFVGHTEFVLSVTFSPDGEKIASAGSDRLIRLWDLNGNKIAQPFSGHSGSIRSVSFSPKGEHIVSGSNDKTLRVWNLEGEQVCQPFSGHTDEIWSVAFSPKSELIISGSIDKTVRIWDFQGRTIKAPFRGHTDGIVSVAFNPKGNRIVSGSRDQTVRLWDLEGNAIGEPFSGHSGAVSSVSFSPDGKRIVSSGKDKTIRIWDLDGNHVSEPFFGHTGAIWSACFSPEGDWIVSAGRDNAVWLWRIGDWHHWLCHCCNMLINHTALAFPQNETARKACDVCEQVWTRQQSAQFAVAQGSALARKGAVDEAIEKFERAKALDPTLSIDSVARAHQLAEWSKAG